MFKDRVYETSTTTGTGSFTLAGAVTGYRTFTAAFGAAAAYYTIINRTNPAEWEVGSYTVSGATLARVAGNVLSGSAGAGVLVNFTAGTKDIFNSPPASVMATWNSTATNAITAASGTVSGSTTLIYTLSKSGSSAVLTSANCNCNCCTDC